jgi:hypothetical protein
MEEIIEKRRESNKTFDLGKGKKRIEAFAGPIHYKEHYDDPKEQWKDIDLTWEDNKITRAPYILVHKGNAISVTNRKTGEVHELELLEKTKLRWERTRTRARARLEDEVIEIIPGRAFVRFRRGIKSSNRPLETQWRLNGDPKKMRFLASCPAGRLPVEATIKDGILSEIIKPRKELSFPIRFDPTIDTYEVTASTDDIIWLDYTSEYSRDFEHVGAGFNPQDPPTWPPHPLDRAGCAMRFVDIDIEKDSIISAAYLTFRASASRGMAGMMRTDILVEEDVDPATYPDNLADFLTRRGNTPSPGALTAWDFSTVWTKGQDYPSGDFAWQIQLLIEDDDWVALNPISVFWDDQRHRGDLTEHRLAYSWDAANPI